MNRRLEAAVFDVDGMLLNTKEFIFQAFEHSLDHHGHPIPKRTVISSLVGRSLNDSYKVLAPNGKHESLMDIHHKFQLERLHLIKPYEGLQELLSELQEAGIKLGVFSSRRGHLIPSLENAGVLKFFSAVVQGDEVVKHKPHPEGLLKALKKLSVKPSNAAMLGDAAVDIQAGKAAKVALTIGITHGFGTREELEATNPNYIVDSLSEIASILLNFTKS
ncbi:MAG TPA: HAD-IA family hydrolase [Patescibacteria group bacterium]|nr:HAD-IA family hydrolase [Patescibacteria group bacterium]